MKLNVTVNGIAYAVEVEVEEEQRTMGAIMFSGGKKKKKTIEKTQTKN